MGQKPHLQLKDLGSKLQIIPSSIEVLIQILKQAATCLTDMDQSPSASALESMKPFLNAIVKSELLKHQDRDVKLLVATCVCEITRITAPEAPYSDDVLKDIFQLIVSTFSGLSDISSPSFGMEVAMLDTLAKYRSCVVMLDLECDDLVNEIFNTFFAVVRDDHPESVLSSMQSIMAVLLEESEDVREDLLSILLSMLGREKRDVTAAARKLSMNVIQQCIGTLEPSIKEFFLSLVSGKSKPVNSQLQNHEVLYDICCCAPQILSGILPYVTGELQTDQLETRLKAVNLVGDIIALPGISSALAFQPILSEFLKTLTDTDFGVRISVLDHVKSSLLSNPQRPEAPQLISALCDGLMDSDENFRKQVVAVICDVACHALHAVPFDAVNLVAERLHDKSQLVKKYTLERLIEIYRVFCEKSSDNVNPDGYDWIPGKILRCFHDKDFRSDTIESVLCGSLFPSEFAMNDMVKHWVDIFSGLDNVEVKALEKILEQKQRLQEELQKYLALRQNSQDKENPEVQKKIMFCFRVMSRSFADPTEAEESFQILDQLNDTNIWKILTNLVDPNTSFHQTRAYRDDLIKILGEKHQLNEFLNTLYVKCSYLLFNKEHTTAILSEIIRYNSAENDQRIQSCMNILVIIARFSPHLFSGSEEDLVKLLKDSNNDMIKEGTLNVLAKAGGTIREQLAVTSSSVDLMLERLCLEGSRRQAKYAVHALAAITKDDGLKSLSVLYKRLVDTMEEKTNLPTVLQSLGCIAQTAMPVFETRESEIEEFIINKILKSDGKDDHTGASWDDKSDIRVLKIYGIKTIVKSYLPVKDALVRPGIDGLLDILRNMLSYGEISKDIKSSSVDKAHLRLASAKAVLRLARLWDHKIPADIFHLTLRTSETGFPQAKKVFLSKVHQYIKDHNLEAKYACAFILNIFGTNSEEFAEDKQNLTDVIHMYHQERAGQLSGQSDAKPLTTYPEYILPYLVHALANLSCPNIDECKDAEAYKTIYRQLHLILSMLVQRDEDVKSEVTADKEKETISAITSIFQSIKLSEDAVDASKSKNSHAICDLGLAITKRLLHKDVDMQGLSHSVSLPPILYKACEKENDLKASEVTTWLADESVLAQFESVELESVPSQSAEDHALKDSEKDRNEVPLGKIVKKIRSRGTKGKKVVKKNKTMTVETKKAGDDFDIINMVREINLDNLGISTNFESSNGHESSLSKKVQKDPEFGTIKKRKVGEETLAPVPKRKRSAVTHGKSRPSSSSKASQRISEEVPSGGKLLLNAGVSPDTGSKNMQRKLVKGKEPSSEQKIKASENHRIDESDKSEDHDIKSSGKLKTPNKTKNENFKTSAGSTKRQKRKSIGGLAKCTTKEGESDAEDLIGCRVKVWWPLDKKFYKGTVQSYDSSKRKHAILYDDGEVEKLCLEKERWELIDGGNKSNKKLKSSKSPSLHEVSTGKKQRSSGGSTSKKTTKIVNGKPSPSKHAKRGQRKASKTNFHEEGVNESSDSELPNPEKTTIAEAEIISDGSKGEQDEGSDVNITKKKKPNRKRKSVSWGKRSKKKKSVSNKKEPDEEKHEPNEEKQEPDAEKQDYPETLSEDREGYPQGAQNDEEENSSKERDADESREASRENVNEEEESGPEGNQHESDVESSPSREVKKSLDDLTSPEDATFAELPDDEPLIKWKPRSGKKRLLGKKQ